MAEALTKTIVEDVSLDTLKAGLADGSIVLIDVREPHEYAAGHIPGSTLNPLQSFDADALPASEVGKRIVLSCRSGRRSITALVWRSKPAATISARIIPAASSAGKAPASRWRTSRTNSVPDRSETRKKRCTTFGYQRFAAFSAGANAPRPAACR